MPNESNLNALFQEFWPSKWNGKEIGEKVEACQKMENYLAAQDEREPYKVQNYDRATRIYGGYTNSYYAGQTNPAEKVIEVNVQGLTSGYEVLRALANESVHADQHELIKTMEKATENPGVEPEYKKALEKKKMSEADVIVMKWEFEHPLHPGYGGGSPYRHRYTNLDSWQRSLEFLTRNYMRMGDEQDQYRHPNTNEEMQTNFKEYLNTREEDELTTGDPLFRESTGQRVGRDLVNVFSIQKGWLDDRRRDGMFSARNGYGAMRRNNILSPAEQEKLSDVFLNGPTKLEDFGIFNRVRHWEKDKLTCLEESENTAQAEKRAEGKSGRVTLDELEGKQQKKRMKRPHEMDPAEPVKSKTCTML